MNAKNAVVFSCTFTPPSPSGQWGTKQKATWASNRRFYSCNAAHNEIDVTEYIADGEKVERPDNELLQEQAAQRLNMDLSNRLPDKNEARNISEYVTRFNSLGAFGLNGAMTQSEIDEWREAARKTKSIIWHGVVSFPSEQSKLIGYEDAERLMRQTFGRFLKNAGFDPNNVALLCAMHSNTENKHVHFTFYEREPKYRNKNGEVGYRAKGKIDNAVLNEYRMSATAYLDEHKRDLYNYRNAAVNGIRGLNVVPTDRDLYVSLCELADKLPKRGRLQYNSENVAEYRKDIDNVVQLLLRRNPNAMQAHKKALSEIARRGKALSETGTKSDYVKRLTEEYKSRLGNVVLGMVKNFRNNPKADVRGEPTTCKQHKAVARRRRTHGAKVIRTAMRMVSGGNKSVQADFTRELHKAEREIEFEVQSSQNAKRS